jgi:hypothetical protein
MLTVTEASLDFTAAALGPLGCQYGIAARIFFEANQADSTPVQGAIHQEMIDVAVILNASLKDPVRQRGLRGLADRKKN